MAQKDTSAYEVHELHVPQSPHPMHKFGDLGSGLQHPDSNIRFLIEDGMRDNIPQVKRARA